MVAAAALRRSTHTGSLAASMLSCSSTYVRTRTLAQASLVFIVTWRAPLSPQRSGSMRKRVWLARLEASYLVAQTKIIHGGSWMWNNFLQWRAYKT